MLSAIVIALFGCAPISADPTDVAFIPASAGKQAATYVIQIAAIASDDSTCLVVWQDQAETDFRVWTARCRLSVNGRLRWLQETPDSVTIPRCNSFAVVPRSDAVGIVYQSEGKLYLRQDMKRGPPIAITPDGDYVRAFTVLVINSRLIMAAIAHVSSETGQSHTAVIEYEFGSDQVIRRPLADVKLTRGWPIPPPSMTADSDSLRLLVGLDHGSLETIYSSVLTQGTTFMSFSRPIGDPQDWSGPSVFLRPLSTRQLSGQQIGSYAAIPGARRGWILSNGGTHILREAEGNIQELAVSGPEASGDAYGRPRVAAMPVSDSTVCLAWIDAERQMLSGGALRASGEAPTLYGGDIRHAVLNTRKWMITPPETAPILKGGTAEAMTLVRLGGKLLLVWGGPRATHAAKDRPHQYVSATTIKH